MSDDSPRKRDDPDIKITFTPSKRNTLTFTPVLLLPGDYDLMAFQGPADGQSYKLTVPKDGDPRPQRTHCIALLGTPEMKSAGEMPIIGDGWYRPAVRVRHNGTSELCLLWDQSAGSFGT